KKFIIIPRKVEETYFKKFVAPLVAAFDVYAKGFEIVTQTFKPVPYLTFSELSTSTQQVLTLFDEKESSRVLEDDKILFELTFRYGQYSFRSDQTSPVSVKVEHEGENYVFHRIKRSLKEEKHFYNLLREMQLELRGSKLTLPKHQAFGWLQFNKQRLQEEGFNIRQSEKSPKRYFLGPSSLEIEVRENIDWFDIYAVVRFGDYEVPFAK